QHHVAVLWRRGRSGCGKSIIGAVVVVSREGESFQAVLALQARRGFANLLDCGQKQTNQDRDNGAHTQQFSQRKCTARGPNHVSLHGCMGEPAQRAGLWNCMREGSIPAAQISCGYPMKRESHAVAPVAQTKCVSGLFSGFYNMVKNSDCA